MSINILGFMLLCAVMLPNIAFLIWKPVDQKPVKSSIWDILEHIGRIASMIFLCFDLGKPYLSTVFASKGLFIAWVISTSLITGLYIGIWMRYFLCGRTVELCYKSFFIPMPLVILPVLDFLITGILGANLALIISSILLGIGHIMVSLSTKKQLSI